MIESKSIWLSAVSQSSDYMEGKLVSQAVERLSKRDNLEPAAITLIQDAITLMEELFDGLAFCLSEDGDLLSQWRGYASDASGMSIGFDSGYLKGLVAESRGLNFAGLNLQQIKYEVQEHDDLVEPTYQEMRHLLDSGALKLTGRRGLLDLRSDDQIAADDQAIRSAQMKINMAALSLFGHLFLLKSPAFREEREWRLVSYLAKPVPDDCLYRVRNQELIPYRSYELKEADRGALREVKLGPRQTTPVRVIENFLKSKGFPDVLVSKSAASYR